jgi:hypothetical protein
MQICVFWRYWYRLYEINRLLPVVRVALLKPIKVAAGDVATADQH